MVKTKDSKNRWYELFTQQENDSCGPACVAMAYHYVTDKTIGEDWMRDISQKYPDAWDPGQGTGMDNLVGVLRDQKVSCSEVLNPGADNLATFLRFHVAANKRTPAIVHIRWRQGGGHFAVVPRVDDDGRVIFLDPWYGLLEIDAHNLPQYFGSGSLSGLVITTDPPR
ncbi:MAG: cysteine peptidase family C39 domain-containing protein [Planctomycetota bacterium]|jgi:ABC-type bacteriocin/lantibiotic exporter with double-glycine peptidase domain